MLEKGWQNRPNDTLVKVHTVKAETLDDCFRQMYELRRSARYDNQRVYKFEDESLEEKYWDWKSKNETFEMYYGNGVVD